MTDRRHAVTVDDFFPGAGEMRRVFDDRLGTLRGAPPERFVWDYWHVPDQYTYIRTFAEQFFPSYLYAQFLERLMAWAAERFEPGQLAFNAAPQLDGLEDPKVRHTTAVHADSVGRWRAWLTPEEVRAAWRDTRDLWTHIDPEAQEPFA